MRSYPPTTGFILPESKAPYGCKGLIGMRFAQPFAFVRKSAFPKRSFFIFALTLVSPHSLPLGQPECAR